MEPWLNLPTRQMAFLILVAILLGGGIFVIPDSTQAAFKKETNPLMVVFDEDFEDGAGTAWCHPITTQAPNGQRFLGEYGNLETCLTLDQLPFHYYLIMEFDLYILRSWDGAEVDHGVIYPNIIGPDRWVFGVSGQEPLLTTTFSNWKDSKQHYPHTYLGGDLPSLSGASAVNTLGYTFGSFAMDSTYHMAYRIDHNAQSLHIDFIALWLQSIEDESWGLDNVRVTLVTIEQPFHSFLPIAPR